MGLEISREWGKDPDWFFSLDAESQVQLWAWWRVHTDPQGKHYKPAKKTDLSNLAAEHQAALNAKEDAPAPTRHIAPRPKIVAKRGGASHVKRR